MRTTNATQCNAIFDWEKWMIIVIIVKINGTKRVRRTQTLKIFIRKLVFFFSWYLLLLLLLLLFDDTVDFTLNGGIEFVGKLFRFIFRLVITAMTQCLSHSHRNRFHNELKKKIKTNNNKNSKNSNNGCMFSTVFYFFILLSLSIWFGGQK